MLPPAAPTSAPGMNGWRGHGQYAFMGLPLAFVALPLYVHLPHWYASQFGVSLAALGAVLLLARLFDALTDPWLGRWSDRLYLGSPAWFFGVASAVAGLMWVAVAGLFFPPWGGHAQHASLLLGMFLGLILSTAAFSYLSIAHQSWGARWGGSAVQRTRIVAWREGAGLAGVVLASVLPSALGWHGWLATLAVALCIGLLAWSQSDRPAPRAAPHHHIEPLHRSNLLHPWRQRPFRRLMLVFVLSGLASAIPATLVLFFIQDRLLAPRWEPLFLATYFVAAALSLPLWMRAVARWGLARAWLLGMLLSVAVFAWATTLGQGDVWAFWWVCALSGLALGADLALPAALLAGVIDAEGDRGQREGAYFGWWNLAAKLNLALAAGLALPVLDALGYTPGQPSPEGLWALTVAYAVLPCLIKLLAAACLYWFFVRPPPAQPHPMTRTTHPEAP